jgi:hypothetical protein
VAASCGDDNETFNSKKQRFEVSAIVKIQVDVV